MNPNLILLMRALAKKLLTVTRDYQPHARLTSDFERSRMKLSVLAEIGILKFPQQAYRQHELWVVVDRTRYTGEGIIACGFCL